MLRIGRGIDPFLRRPFTIYDIKGERVEILYKVVGRGTNMMKDLKEGETVSLLGPLGNGFDLNGFIENPVLVAGGTGIASLNMLVKRLAEGRGFKGGALLIGGKTSGDIIPFKKYIDMGYKVEITTEDGSLGKKGLVTDLLEERVSDKSVIFACGPNEMLKKVLEIARSRGIPSQLSLESVMACGVGVCLGCAVEVEGEERYKLVCKDGPVFKGEEIRW